MDRALVFDTETTSLIKNTALPLDQQPRVIEFFGAIVGPDGEIIEELELMVNPCVLITEEITRITGIKPEDVAEKPRWKDVADKATALIGSCDAVVAHNLSYDFKVMNFEAERMGTQLPWPKIRICTVEETEWIKGHRLNLNALHTELLGVPFEGAHRAREDVMALVRCFNELRSRGDI